MSNNSVKNLTYEQLAAAAPNRKRATKTQRTLTALLTRSYNRFEAERLLHDHALHSTVSSIQNQHGVQVARTSETVPGFLGAPTRVTRYWIAPEQREAAKKLLIKMGGVKHELEKGD